MACPNCGSWAVRADRSLSGRMICGRCGEPLGIGQQKHRGPALRAHRNRRGGRRTMWLALAALVAVSAVLAGLAERWQTPPLRPDFRIPTERSPQSRPGSLRSVHVAIR